MAITRVVDILLHIISVMDKKNKIGFSQCKKESEQNKLAKEFLPPL
ncbi:MAG: hypothetical protein LC437_09980 [Thiohalomonas sp.]|nr:hypothetical protein [Thiohalomonas sp.]